MGHKFERCRMETQDDGSVSIGIQIVATIGQSDEPDPAFGTSAQWRPCKASHEHGWDTCDIRSIFGARAKDAQGQDIAGTSAREQLLAWLQAQRTKKQVARPERIPLPTRTVIKQVDGKDVEVEEEIKDVTLT